VKKTIRLAICFTMVGCLYASAADAACTISATNVVWMMDNNITVDLDKGGSSTFTPRRMIKGTEPLTYNLYLNAARTTIWGDGTGGTSRYSDPNPPNKDTIVTIYGRVPAGQDVTAGAYTDTVTATITW
jgi:spore coat protein U-like protein